MVCTGQLIRAAACSTSEVFPEPVGPVMVSPSPLGADKKASTSRRVFAEQVVPAGRDVRVCNVCKTLAYHARRRIDTERG